jgi:hypothetical protein
LTISLSLCNSRRPARKRKRSGARLARLGVEAGKPVDFKTLFPEQKEGMVAGVKEGEAKVKEFAAGGVKKVVHSNDVDTLDAATELVAKRTTQLTFL